MDSKGLFCLCVLGALGIMGARAADPCTQDYQQCLQAMMPLIQALGSSAQSDPNGNIESTTDAIFGILCSPEGREAMNCMLGVMKRCPSVMAGAGGASGGMFPGLNMTEIQMQGGMEIACEMFTGECKKIMPCIQAAAGENPGSMSPGGDQPVVITTPYSMLPMQLTAVCGAVWGALQCIDRYEKDCPNFAEKLRQQSRQQSQQGSAQDPSGMDYDQTVTFMKQACPAMPADFMTDHQCEDQALASDEFVACYTNMSTTYNIGQAEKLSCKVYDDNKNCIDTHVKPSCGKESAKFLKAGSGMAVKGLPSVAECEPQVDGAGFLQASGTLVMITSIFLLGRL